MARDNVMSTPIFDELLREMAQRAEPRAPAPAANPPQDNGGQAAVEQPRSGGTRRRHRAD